MELVKAIERIIDGDAVILMGAGASYGAKNSFGDFPSGSRLAKDLYSSCFVNPDDENDLQDASQCYLEKYSPQKLITEIRSLLTCASFTESHEEIYSLPWMRYYTTNYDDVALLAAKNRGTTIIPVTLNSPFKHNSNIDSTCIHINGHIGNLNEKTLNNEFKLTSVSYLAQENILKSSWGKLLLNDLESAKCIVVLGLSLKYDLDLSRIIYNADSVEKTIIIDSDKLTANAENRLKRFGTVYKIGVDGFAKSVIAVKNNYKPRVKAPLERIYIGFKYVYSKKNVMTPPNANEVFDLFLCGRITDNIFHKTNGKFDGLIFRQKLCEIEKAIENKKRFVFIHSEMGNGKTILINELIFRLSNRNLHIFSLEKPEFSKITEEISEICAIKNPVLVIVEDYTQYMEILYKFMTYDISNIQFVFTARTALNYNKMPEVLRKFCVKENESVIFDINKLNGGEINQCINIFDRYGLFGEKAGETEDDKFKYLRSRKGGNGRFQSIMLEVLKSKVMQDKVERLVDKLKNDSSEYYNATILILIIQLMNLRVSITDIEQILELDISKDALFKDNNAIKELISYGKQNTFLLKSPVTAKYILQKITDPIKVIEILKLIAEYAVKYSDNIKYNNILISIISYSHINTFLREFNDSENFLLNYYDQISEIEYYRINHFFWLQYAISCIEIKRYDRAQKYIDDAYGLTPDGFNPFQINNQQARLYLEMIINDKSNNVLEDFKSAHKLLMLPITSEKDDEYNVVRLFGYYCRYKMKNSMKNGDEKQYYKLACNEAYECLNRFMEKNKIYYSELKDLKNKLLKICFS